MPAPTHSELTVLCALRAGEPLTEERQRDLHRDHLRELAERLRPREPMPCGIAYDPHPGTF